MNVEVLYGEVYEAIEKAKPIAEVGQALNDEMYDSGIITDQNHDALVGSRLFNVAMAAMDSLRRDPKKPVVEEVVDIAEPEDWLARFTLRVLNDSLIRPEYINLPRFKSSRVKKLGTCAISEERFVEAAHDLKKDFNDEAEPSLFMVDSGGHPILFKKQRGEPSTLNLKPVQVNNVRYPAGTLFNMQETDDLEIDRSTDFQMAAANSSNIESIAPLRFTAFAFKVEERARVLRPVKGYELDDESLLEFDNSLSDLAHFLPDQKTLRQIYRSITNGAVR